MKAQFAALLSICTLPVFSQTASKSTFFIKGQEWQYQNFYPSFGIGGKINGHYEVTSFDYKVDAVKDSAGIRYSYITKTGTAFNNEELQWHRNFVVRSDEQTFFLPADYYFDDSIYLCDKYPKLNKKKLVLSSLHADGDSIRYPLVMDSGSELNLNDFNYRGVFKDPVQRDQLLFLGDKSGMGKKVDKGRAIETSRKLIGIEKVKTPAGEFTCFHIRIGYQLNKAMSTIIDEFYCPGIGIVRSEDIHGTYMELTRIKKKV